MIQQDWVAGELQRATFPTSPQPLVTLCITTACLLAIQKSGPHAGAAGTKNYPGMCTWRQRQEAHLSPGVGYQPRQCVETIKKEKEEKDYQVAFVQVKVFGFSLVQG